MTSIDLHKKSDPRQNFRQYSSIEYSARSMKEVSTSLISHNDDKHRMRTNSNMLVNRLPIYRDYQVVAIDTKIIISRNRKKMIKREELLPTPLEAHVAPNNEHCLDLTRKLPYHPRIRTNRIGRYAALLWFLFFVVAGQTSAVPPAKSNRIPVSIKTSHLIFLIQILRLKLQNSLNLKEFSSVIFIKTYEKVTVRSALSRRRSKVQSRLHQRLASGTSVLSFNDDIHMAVDEVDSRKPATRGGVKVCNMLGNKYS